MDYTLKRAKEFFRITAVILSIIFALTACNSDSLNFPISPTAIPLTNTSFATSTAVPFLTNTISPTPPPFNNIEQILFAPGSFTANPGNNLGANESYSYTLYGRAGQLLIVNIAASHNEMSFTILGADAQELGKTKGSGAVSATLPTDGDYFIKAAAPRENGRQYGYILEIILSSGHAVPTTMVFAVPPTIPPAQPPPTMLPPVPPTMIAATAVPIPQAEPITIEPGKTTTKSGQLNGSAGKQYVLSGMAGQTLTIYAQASQPGIIVSVMEQDGTSVGEFRSSETFSAQLPTTQNYFLTITPQTSNTSLEYSITIAVINPPPSPNLERITLAAGSEPVHFSGTMSQNVGKTYVFAGAKGQTLQIDATPSNSGITISVHGADSTMLGWTTAGIQFSTILPMPQDYYITLMPPTGTSDLDYGITIMLR